MSSIYDWSLKASENANADAIIDWEEGQPPSSVNNSARAMMQRMREYVADASGDVTVGGDANVIRLVPHCNLTKLFDGLRASFFARFMNSKAVTISYNDLGNVALYKMGLSSLISLTGGELRAGGFYEIVYKSDLVGGAKGWLLLNPSPVQQFPIGMIAPFAQTSLPQGWIECNGRALSRKDYNSLFMVIGTTWGQGDSKNTFNIPDFRGMFLRGWDNTRGLDEDKKRSFASLQKSANLSHMHEAKCEAAGQHSHNFQHVDIYDGYGGVRWGDNRRTQDNPRQTSAEGLHGHKITIEVSGGAESRPVNMAVIYAIKT